MVRAAIGCSQWLMTASAMPTSPMRINVGLSYWFDRIIIRFPDVVRGEYLITSCMKTKQRDCKWRIFKQIILCPKIISGAGPVGCCASRYAGANVGAGDIQRASVSFEACTRHRWEVLFVGSTG